MYISLFSNFSAGNFYSTQYETNWHIRIQKTVKRHCETVRTVTFYIHSIYLKVAPLCIAYLKKLTEYGQIENDLT